MTENKKNVCLPKRLIASRKLIVNLAKMILKRSLQALISVWYGLSYSR